MNRLLSTGTVMLAFALGASCNGDDNTGPDPEDDFEATLTGAAERPTPVTTSATGTASVTLDDQAQTITFTVNVTNLTSPTLAHIHTGGPQEAGPPVVNLLLTAPPAGTFNGQLASGTRGTTDITGGETYTSLAAKIRAGNAYINVHTVAFPNGEIRGQLVADD